MLNLTSFHSSDKGSGYINNSYKYARSKARVFFVRHGESIEYISGNDSIPQSFEAKLSHIGMVQMRDVGMYFKLAGIKLNDDVVMFSDDTIRSIESAKIIIQNMASDIKNLPGLKRTRKLRTTIKGFEGIKKIKEDMKVSIDTNKLMYDILYQVNQHSTDNTDFILLGHKSNKSGVTAVLNNHNEQMQISFDIKNGEILELDINADTKEYIDPKKHPETLFLNRRNYKIIIRAIKDISELKIPLQKFQKNKNGEEKYPIWKLQNDVNNYFHTHTESFQKYLIHPLSPKPLRIFCLINLLK